MCVCVHHILSVMSPQRIVLHRPVMLLGPIQDSPRILGSGELQYRFLVPIPPLQLALHVHGPHSDHPPSKGGPSISVK